MGGLRATLLWASQNRWLGEHVRRWSFVKRTAAHFMPGEDIEDALAAARLLAGQGLGTIFTHLGEDVSHAAEAEAVTRHYRAAIDRLRAASLPTALSVKLTHLGMGLSADRARDNVEAILQHAGPTGTVWIDMEASSYVDRSLDVFRRLRRTYSNVGVCLQAYLHRTAQDLESLLPLGSAIRLVKGAYLEPASRAFPRKGNVNSNFLALAERLMSDEARRAGVRTGIATHDRELIRRIEALARSQGLTQNDFEFQMLYGIQPAEQLRLVKAGWKSSVLISYGAFWFPWFMRRLAERPANMTFLLRNILDRQASIARSRKALDP